MVQTYEQMLRLARVTEEERATWLAPVLWAPTVSMPDAHDSIGAGCYRARALPGAE